MITCGIVGVSGYAGMELLKLMTSHPSFTLQAVMSDSQTGAPVTTIYPWMRLEALPLQSFHPSVYEQLDVLFLATPSGVSTRYLEQLHDYHGVVIDLSGDLRLKADTYAAWYPHEPIDANLQQRAVYGLTEWNRGAIEAARWIANPGCYATAIALGLLPFIQDGCVRDEDIIVSACSGITGAGKALSDRTHHARSNENVQLYKIHTHQHVPEIEQTIEQLTGQHATIHLSTHLLPINRGIMATMHLVPTVDRSEQEWVDWLTAVYADEPFIRVQHGQPEIRTAVGSNYCDLWVYADERTKRLTVVAVIDNMQKGAAGQAIQNANVRFGLDETTGLLHQPIYI